VGVSTKDTSYDHRRKKVRRNFASGYLGYQHVQKGLSENKGINAHS